MRRIYHGRLENSIIVLGELTIPVVQLKGKGFIPPHDNKYRIGENSTSFRARIDALAREKGADMVVSDGSSKGLFLYNSSPGLRPSLSKLETKTADFHSAPVRSSGIYGFFFTSRDEIRAQRPGEGYSPVSLPLDRFSRNAVHLFNGNGVDEIELIDFAKGVNSNIVLSYNGMDQILKNIVIAATVSPEDELYLNEHYPYALIAQPPEAPF